MEGHSLLPVLGAGQPRREAALFGYFGGAVNVTDGRYTYHRFPADLQTQEIYQYTLMPTHIYDAVHAGGARRREPRRALRLHQGRRLLKVPVIERSPMYNNYGPGALLESDTRLYDLETRSGPGHGRSATRRRSAA